MNTCTFTARDAGDPRVIATFTLQGDSLRVDMGALLEDLERIMQPKEGTRGAARLLGWVKPLAVSLLQRRTRIVARPGRFPGPFDYWSGWLFTASLAAGLIMAWTMRRRWSRRHG